VNKSAGRPESYQLAAVAMVEDATVPKSFNRCWPVAHTNKKGSGTLPTQVLTCSGAKGLSQPALWTALSAMLPVLPLSKHPWCQA